MAQAGLQAQPPRGSSTSGRILQTKVKGESPRVQLQKKLKMSASVINSLNIQRLVLTLASICAYLNNQCEVRAHVQGREHGSSFAGVSSKFQTSLNACHVPGTARR